MRIFIDGANIKHLSRDNISQYLSREAKRSLVYSESGIFKVLNNKMIKLRIQDSEINKIKLDTYTLLIDQSEVKNDEEYFQIPVEHFIEHITIFTYELRPNASIKLIIETMDSKIADMYFTTDKSINSIGIKDDIITFLSLLKFDVNI